VASEAGTAQTTLFTKRVGLEDQQDDPEPDSNVLERTIKEGKNPVERERDGLSWNPEYDAARETVWEAGETTLQG
jgi:hypothetical protein